MHALVVLFLPPTPKYNYVPVAQLDRVLASDAKGCEFEPRRVRHKC